MSGLQVLISAVSEFLIFQALSAPSGFNLSDTRLGCKPRGYGDDLRGLETTKKFKNDSFGGFGQSGLEAKWYIFHGKAVSST